MGGTQSKQSLPAYHEPFSEASLSRAAPALTTLSVLCFPFNTFKPNISKSGFTVLIYTSGVGSRCTETILGIKASKTKTLNWLPGSLTYICKTDYITA